MKKKRGVGRPRAQAKRSHRIVLMLTAEEYMELAALAVDEPVGPRVRRIALEAVRADAVGRGLSLADHVRDILLADSRKGTR